MKLKKQRSMRVQCGSLKWRGKAVNTDDAIIAALGDAPPIHPSTLLRVFDGQLWFYIEFKAALKIAGYKVVEIPEREGGGYCLD